MSLAPLLAPLAVGFLRFRNNRWRRAWWRRHLPGAPATCSTPLSDLTFGVSVYRDLGHNCAHPLVELLDVALIRKECIDVVREDCHFLLWLSHAIVEIYLELAWRRVQNEAVLAR